MQRLEKVKRFLALVDTVSSQILVGVHIMGKFGGGSERAR